jgi:hypothetical protein
MNWAEVSAVVSLLTLVLILVGGGAMWGTLTEKVTGLTKRADGHKAEISALDVRVNGHDVEIAKLVEWKAGYNAAASVGRHTAEV